MTEQTKNYVIDFFTGRMATDAQRPLPDLLWDLAAEEQGPVWTKGTFSYDLRDMRRVGQNVRGVLAKFRTDQIPHLGQPGGRERELALGEGEGLIEKNYFLYNRRDNLLVYQRNGHASRVNRLAEYLTDQCGETVTFDPVLQEEATERLLREGVEPLALELSFTRPTNPDFYPGDEWDDRMIQLANEAGGARMFIRISSDRRNPDEDRTRLRDRMRRAASGFVDAGLATVARMRVLNDGIEHPIDLIADRLESRQVVEMNGRYPLPESIYAALNNAVEEEREALDAILGRPGRRLR